MRGRKSDKIIISILYLPKLLIYKMIPLVMWTILTIRNKEPYAQMLAP